MSNNVWYGALLILLSGVTAAQQDESAAARQDGPLTPNSVRGVAVAQNNIFAGTSLNGPGGNNDVFLIDPATDIATSFLVGVPIWGATFDAANGRILYTTEGGADSAVDGAPLYEIPTATGVPSLLGVITDGTGTDFRIDGLALSGGVLYGSRAAASADGIYSIDMTTFQATLEIPLTDSISGIDADPDTGVIYGVNDTTLQLVSIDVGAGMVTNVAAYPDPAETDIDGLAVGNGRAYLVPDDSAPGLIYVYDIATATFLTPLTAPWGAVDDTFSGAAFTAGSVLPEPVEVPVLGGPWRALIILLVLAGAGYALLRRRQSGLQR